MGKVYTELDADVHLYFFYFLKVTLQGHADSTGKVKPLRFNNICLSDYDLSDRNWCCQKNAAKFNKQSVSQVPKAFVPQTLASAPSLLFFSILLWSLPWLEVLGARLSWCVSRVSFLVSRGTPESLWILPTSYWPKKRSTKVKRLGEPMQKELRA